MMEKARFGRKGVTCLWIEGKSLRKVMEVLRHGIDAPFDWLENFSVAHIEEALVPTWFLRSRSSEETLVLRASVVPESANACVTLPSTADLWPMIQPLEDQAAELFGIRFTPSAKEEAHQFLPNQWIGYPLRKNYVFPREFLGIEHARREYD